MLLRTFINYITSKYKFFHIKSFGNSNQSLASLHTTLNFNTSSRNKKIYSFIPIRVIPNLQISFHIPHKNTRSVMGLPLQEDSFLLFKSSLQKYYQENNIKKELPSNTFLEWLIGFTEGDGSFISNRGSCIFILIQGTRNKNLLKKIHQILPLGQIKSQSTPSLQIDNPTTSELLEHTSSTKVSSTKNSNRSTNVSHSLNLSSNVSHSLNQIDSTKFKTPRVLRLLIQKRKEIELIIKLFNGNLVLPSKKKEFHKWLLLFKRKDEEIIPSKKRSFLKDDVIVNKKTLHTHSIHYINRKNYPSLNTLWFLGFVEAEGSFSISFLSNSMAFRCRFSVSQKGDINLDVLSHFIILFGVGRIEGHSSKDNYSYIVSGLKNVNKIFSYFDKYINSFQGIKKESYLKFKNLYEKIVEKQHLDLNKRPFLISLSDQINKIPRKIK